MRSSVTSKRVTPVRVLSLSGHSVPLHTEPHNSFRVMLCSAPFPGEKTDALGAEVTAQGHLARRRGSQDRRSAVLSAETVRSASPILQKKLRAGGSVTETVWALESQLCPHGLCASGHNLGTCLSFSV